MWLGVVDSGGGGNAAGATAPAVVQVRQGRVRERRGGGGGTGVRVKGLGREEGETGGEGMVVVRGCEEVGATSVGEEGRGVCHLSACMQCLL